MTSIKLFDRIVLTADLPDGTFKTGDVGTVVEVYNDGEAYEIEFFALDNSTLGVKTVPENLIKPVSARMVLHTRELVR